MKRVSVIFTSLCCIAFSSFWKAERFFLLDAVYLFRSGVLFDAGTDAYDQLRDTCACRTLMESSREGAMRRLSESTINHSISHALMPQTSLAIGLRIFF